MKKTRIEFKDIQAGDLIEAVDKVHGVKMSFTGIAFEEIASEWRTSQGGIIVTDGEEGVTIWRIDARVSRFDDIQPGDLIQVTSTLKDTEVILTGVAHHIDKAAAEWFDGWKTEAGETLCRRLTSTDEKIVILERNEK